MYHFGPFLKFKGYQNTNVSNEKLKKEPKRYISKTKMIRMKLLKLDVPKQNNSEI